jgi:hypothetical protein
MSLSGPYLPKEWFPSRFSGKAGLTQVGVEMGAVRIAHPAIREAGDDIPEAICAVIDVSVLDL